MDAIYNVDIFLHQYRVANYAYELSQKLGFSDLESRTVMLCGFIHDIGKYHIDKSILLKPSRLTNEEYEIMKIHTTIGFDILRKANIPTNICNAVLYHHENFDGTGYPGGFRGEEIPPYSRIIKIVDVYDALTSSRPYRLCSHSQLEAIKIMDQMESEFDPSYYGVFRLNVLESSTFNPEGNISNLEKCVSL